MKIERFEDSLAWQKAKELCIEIYLLFDKSHDFGFKDQIERATALIMNITSPKAMNENQTSNSDTETIPKMLSNFIKKL